MEKLAKAVESRLLGEVFWLASGYARTKRDKAIKRPYRAMTIAEAKALHAGQRVAFLANDNTARELTVNGKPQTWKRTPDRVEVPIKYGMYEYGRLSSLSNGTVERLLVALPTDEEVNS